MGSALALRFLGAVHRLVLEGRAPALARHYPSAGGEAGLEGAWAAFRDTLEQQRDTLRGLVHRPCQTNEVGRAAALFGGFLLVARETGLPLRLLEIGASAGLNLRWDHYRYEQGDAGWGDRASPVRLVDVFPDGLPPAARRCRVIERAGCDRLPVDPCSADGQITLLSCLWPDQRERLALLRGALEVARRIPVTIDATGAPAWLATRLAAPVRGVASVVFHSIVMQYLSADDRRRVASVLDEAGSRATDDAPPGGHEVGGVGEVSGEERAGDHEVERGEHIEPWPGAAEEEEGRERSDVHDARPEEHAAAAEAIEERAHRRAEPHAHQIGRAHV